LLKEISNKIKHSYNVIKATTKVLDTNTNIDYDVIDEYYGNDYDPIYSTIHSFHDSNITNEMKLKLNRFHKKNLKLIEKYIEKNSNRKKYKNIKEKPNTLKYEILESNTDMIIDKKNIYKNYELKVSINGLLNMYVFASDLNNYYQISLFSEFESFDEIVEEYDEKIDKSPLEIYQDFKETYDSMYYDLFYEIENYKNNKTLLNSTNP